MNNILCFLLKKSWKKYLACYLLFLVICYFFALFGFKYFSDDFDHYCDNLLYCFLTISDYAFKSRGGIGGWLKTIYTESH